MKTLIRPVEIPKTVPNDLIFEVELLFLHFKLRPLERKAMVYEDLFALSIHPDSFWMLIGYLRRKSNK